MSFTPGFAPDAKTQWVALEFDLQELVLDELEKLALNPPGQGEHILDLIHEAKNRRYYIFLRVWVDHARRKVTAVGVGHVGAAGQ